MSTGKACCIGEWSRSTIRRLYQILFRKWSCSFTEKFINQRRLNYVLYQFFCLTVRGWNISRTSRTCTADKAWGLRWWWSSEFWSFGTSSPMLSTQMLCERVSIIRGRMFFLKYCPEGNRLFNQRIQKKKFSFLPAWDGHEFDLLKVNTDILFASH